MTSAEPHIAGYRIERVIRSGGMGTVYLAQNPTLPRYDALKVLSAQLSVDREFRARFWREAEVASRLDHPNIVSIYRRGETPAGQLWIAMQFVNGTDAEAASGADGMTPGRATHIVAEVAKALDYAHSQRVVHRDVKPANILLSNQGTGERVLLSDFGIARALDDASFTATGSVMATADYAAPEVLSGRPVDHRADVYSLGCTLFRLITGKTPFPATGGVAAAMIAHLEQSPPRLSALVPGLPAALDQVVYRVLAKDPAERYQSAGAFATAAAAALQGRPGAVQPDPISGPREWRGRAGTPTVPAQVGPPQWPGPAAKPPSSAPRRKRGPIVGLVSATVLVAAGVATAVVMRDSSHDASVSVSTPPSGPTPVRPGALRGLLLSRDDIDTVIGAQLDPSPISMGLDASSDFLVEKECAGAWSPGLVAAYTGSGWLGAVEQALNEAAPERIEQSQLLLPRRAIQTVVGFQSAERAASFLANQKDVWLRCSNRTVTINGPNQSPGHLNLGVSADGPDNTVTITNGFEGGMDNKCTHALGVRNNVSIDVEACSRGNTEEQAEAILQKITAKVATK